DPRPSCGGNCRAMPLANCAADQRSPARAAARLYPDAGAGTDTTTHHISRHGALVDHGSDAGAACEVGQAGHLAGGESEGAVGVGSGAAEARAADDPLDGAELDGL